MTPQKRDFLALMRIALRSTEISPAPCGDIAWEEVFRLAEQHHVLALVVDAAYRVYGNDIPPDSLAPYKARARRMTYLQAVKTERFLDLCRYLAGQGLTPLVMKGLICRDLYPQPDFRFSADEDLLIRPDEAAAYHEALLGYGLKADASEEEIVTSQETPYRSEDKVLFLEVHRYPFPPDSEAYGEYNTFFDKVYDRAETIAVAGTDIRTMAATDHLLYLICHALKHFLHGGCGIRQVCDIGLYAQRYAKEIDWPQLADKLRGIRAKDFTASLLVIAEGSFGIDLKEVPEELRKSGTDPEALLEDILDSGVYGSSTMSRKHSSAMTLGAAERAGTKATGRKHSLTRTLFPPASSLTKLYPYLIKKPWLLPIAWLQRICRYLKERGAGNTPGEALRIGHERVSLMEQYGLLKDKPAKQVDTREYLEALLELIKEGHEASIPVAGASMTPFLGDKRDQVFVKAPERPIRKGDIVLYKRRNGDFVLHRVYRVHKEKDKEAYDIIGDAQDIVEPNIQKEQIFAVVTRAKRKGKVIEPGCFYWWFFQHIWIRMIPLRRQILRVYTAIR